MKKLLPLFALLYLVICPIGCSDSPPPAPPEQAEQVWDDASEAAALQKIENEATTDQ